LIGTLFLWYFALLQIDNNSKTLLARSRVNPSSPVDITEEISPEDIREGVSHEEDVPYAKKVLYRYEIQFDSL
jgi:hypothetical protein